MPAGVYQDGKLQNLLWDKTGAAGAIWSTVDVLRWDGHCHCLLVGDVVLVCYVVGQP